VITAIPATIVIGILTFIFFACHIGFPTVSFCFLIVVVLQSVTGSFLSSALVSTVAFLSLNYYFVPPIFSLRVSDASDTLALISFLLTGLVITRLTSQQRTASNSERLQRKETTRLYMLARSLLTLGPETAAGPELLKRFKTEFDLRAVCFFDGASAELFMEGDSQDNLGERTKSAFISVHDHTDEDHGLAVRVLRIEHKVAGSIGFEGLRDVELTAGPLTALAVLTMERSRSFHLASCAVAAAETETFRGAVLDALAHEFMTPMATILTAAGGIEDLGPLLPKQLELAQTIESEASRLTQLTSRLLRLARLDSEEVKPQSELTDLKDLVSSLAAQYSRRWPDHRLRMVESPAVNVNGDRELLGLGLGQLLDNACKYSAPNSDIAISIEDWNGAATVQVWNSGASIPRCERASIFDRFYRGERARQAIPGSGLGLYVARKIALAHGGSLELDPVKGEGIAFRFAVPSLSGESGQ
jgi:two-component system sensor histidine kinase KdpD